MNAREAEKFNQNGMRNILCPTDFSETAMHTIGYAAKFAKATGSDLTLLNVQSLFTLTATEAIMGKEATIHALNDRLEKQCKEVARVFKISCYPEIDATIRPLSAVIAERADGFDLIIMGTSGTQDYYHLFFGSNAYRIVKEALVPVILLPPGSGYQDISGIVLAFDYLTAHGVPLAQLAKWAKILESSIRVLQVVKNDYSSELGLQSMQSSVRELYHDLRIRFDMVYSDDVGESIHEYMVGHAADMLALCSVHHGFVEKIFHKSVIRKIVAMAQYPIFIFHDQ